ncbi:hypothetical protein JZ751_003264 [Albula glossodonta]|uniref:Uncharacterized protein n=1 Tax=Albula glossodonta TaxID=121402 RepID=A0A8T2MNA9_9TELE|nr:hypothetical protein JZ751_003264 [Albula glossodonta]
MCPSPTAPPKKLGSASEGLVHVLEPSEDPDMFLQRWPITSPILLVESADLLLAVGTMPLITLPKEMIHQAPLILMGTPTRALQQSHTSTVKPGSLSRGVDISPQHTAHLDLAPRLHPAAQHRPSCSPSSQEA